ncbi:hypothetical protein JCM11641_002891 [Rhodosporidiobolus odoratus]
MATATIAMPPPVQTAHQRRPSQVLPSDYYLDVRQQPRQARMAGSGEKADRRPIDPPPIIRLRIRKPSCRSTPSSQLHDADLRTPTLTHTLFMFASLVPENSEEELYDLAGGKSKLVAGSVVSSLFHLKDQSCFVFPDLSVRTEGRWRLKMSLFELGEEGVQFCSSILTDVFQVYSSKRFPGMDKSTELSKSFARQGLKLRIRRPGTTVADDDEVPPPRPATNGRKASLPRRAPPVVPDDEFAYPHQRRPSAPNTPASSSSAAAAAARKRPWTSYDSAAGPSLPAIAGQHAHSYAPYPARRTATGPQPLLALDLRSRVYPHSHPASAYPASGLPNGSHRSVSSSHPFSPACSASSLASHALSLSHSRPHGALPLSPPSAHSARILPPMFSHPPSSASHILSNSFSHPHPPSLPPILAPIRSLPSYPPPSLSAATVPGQGAEYDAATVAAGAALASLGSATRSRRATESSVRSTGSDEAQPEGDQTMIDEEVEPERGDEAQQQQPSEGMRKGSSLAMLLRDGANAAKDATKEGVSFF